MQTEEAQGKEALVILSLSVSLALGGLRDRLVDSFLMVLVSWWPSM